MLLRIPALLLAFTLPLAPAQAGLLERLGLTKAAPAAPSFLPVEQAFVVRHRQADGRLTLTVDIAPGYYLYRHRLALSAEQAELGDWTLPEGRPHQDEYFGQSQVYHQQLRLQVPLRSTGDGGRVEFRYQGCTTGLCYPPQVLTIALDAAAAD